MPTQLLIPKEVTHARLTVTVEDANGDCLTFDALDWTQDDGDLELTAFVLSKSRGTFTLVLNQEAHPTSDAPPAEILITHSNPIEKTG